MTRIKQPKGSFFHAAKRAQPHVESAHRELKKVSPNRENARAALQKAQLSLPAPEQIPAVLDADDDRKAVLTDMDLAGRSVRDAINFLDGVKPDDREARRAVKQAKDAIERIIKACGGSDSDL